MSDFKESQITRDLSGHQPLYAFIDLVIDGHNISYFGNKDYNESVISLNVERKGKSNQDLAGSTFDIELYDDTALRIEELLANAIPAGKNWKTAKQLKDTGNAVTQGNVDWQNSENKKKDEEAEKANTYTKEDEKKDPTHKEGTKKNVSAKQEGNVRCRYGWCNRKGQVIEDISLIGKALKYTLNFEGPALTLTLNCVAESDVNSTKKLNMTFDVATYGGKPSEIVRAMCQKAGIAIGRIVETKPILGEDGKPKEFKTETKNMREFISDELLEKSEPLDSDKPGYRYFTQVVDGVEKAFFVPNEMYGDMTVVTYKKMEDTTSSTSATTANSGGNAIGNEAYLKVMGVSSHVLGSNRSSDVSVVGSGKVIFVGDSRVKDLSDSIPTNKDIAYIYDGKANYRWLKDNIDTIKSQASLGSRIYMMLGLNDLDNIINYVDYYNLLARKFELMGVQFFVVSVLPVFMAKSNIKNSKIQAFNRAIVDNHCRELHYVDIFNPILLSLKSNNTKEDGISYNKRLMQDVYNRIIYYKEIVSSGRNYDVANKGRIINGVEFTTHSVPDMLSRSSYQGNVSEVETYGDDAFVEELITKYVAVALAESGSEDIATLMSDLDDLRKYLVGNQEGSLKTPLGSTTAVGNVSPLSSSEKVSKPDMNKITQSFMRIFGKDKIDGDISKYIDFVNKFSGSIQGKDSKTIDDYANVFKSIVGSSSVSKIVSDAVKLISENRDKILNNQENNKTALYGGIADSILNTLLPNQSPNIKKIRDKITSVMSLDKDKIKSGDYSEIESLISKELGVNSTAIDTYVKTAKTLVELYKNREYFDIKDTRFMAKDLLTSVVGKEKVGKVQKYVDTAQNIYKALNGAKDVTSVQGAIQGLSDVLGKKSKISKYIDTANSMLDIVNKGQVGTTIFDTNNGIGNIIKGRLPQLTKPGSLGGIVASTTGIANVSRDEVLKANIPNSVNSGVVGLNGALNNATKGANINLGNDGITDEEMKKGVRSITFGGKKQKMEICGEFEIYTGRRDSQVISFSPEFESDKIATDKVPTNALSIDSVRNEMLECTIEGVGGSLASDAYKDRAESTTGVGVVLGMSGSSFKNLESSAASMWSRYFSSVYGASLEIMGNTKVKFDGHIKIAVYTKYGFLHHTSGVYHIQGITDTISDGMFTTSLDLQKNSDKARQKLKGESAKKLDTNKISDTDGKYWVKQNTSVSVEGCIKDVPNALEDLGKWFYDRTGHKLVCTAGTNGEHASGPHSHANGWKMDVNDWFGPEGLSGGWIINSDDSPGSLCYEFIEYGRSIGLGMNFEGDHIDVQMDGSEWNDNNPGGKQDNGGYRG